MIKYITRKELDVDKYNQCIAISHQSEIFAFSWYLDLVVDNWDTLVLDDYEAVMPIPWRKKYLIKYVYPPFWILQLGIFSKGNTCNESEFLEVVEKHFKFIELRLNTKNFTKGSSLKTYHKLAISNPYKEIAENYRKDRKKDLRKAEEHQLMEVWDNDVEQLIQLFKNNVGKRTPEIKENDYQNLKELLLACLERGVGEVLSVYKGEDLVASGFFLLHQKTVTILCSSTDFNNRKNGANTFLIDRAIHKYIADYDAFYFGGSSIPTVADYFLSFGATALEYGLYSKKVTPF